MRELARPAYFHSAAKIAISVAYPLCLYFFSDRYPFLIGFFIFLPACALTVFRHLHALFVHPFIRVSDGEFHIRSFQIRFLLPIVVVVERRIPRGQLTQCLVHTLSINGLATSTLKLAWAGGALDLDPFVFAESADTLQTRMLDAATPPPTSAEGLELAVLNRRRFTRPLLVRANPYLWRAAAALALSGFLLVLLPALMPDTPWMIWAGAPIIPGIVAVVVFSFWLQRLPQRSLELGPDGLLVGARRVRWEEIAHTRLSTLERSGSKITTGLRVTLVSGDAIELSTGADYPLPYARLKELIQPPADAVRAVSSLSDPEQIEEALGRLGLAQRPLLD